MAERERDEIAAARALGEAKAAELTEAERARRVRMAVLHAFARVLPESMSRLPRHRLATLTDAEACELGADMMQLLLDPGDAA